MKTKIDRLIYMREAFRVRRYHTIPFVAIEETVGHHTVNMLMLLYFLYDDVPPTVVLRTLFHDAPELVTGDIPAPAKWANKEFDAALRVLENTIIKDIGLYNKELPELDENLLKYADLMDLCFKCVEEIAIGNQIFFSLLTRGILAVHTLLIGPLKNHANAMLLYRALEDNPHVMIPNVLEMSTPQGVKH